MPIIMILLLPQGGRKACRGSDLNQ